MLDWKNLTWSKRAAGLIMLLLASLGAIASFLMSSQEAKDSLYPIAMFSVCMSSALHPAAFKPRSQYRVAFFPLPLPCLALYIIAAAAFLTHLLIEQVK